MPNELARQLRREMTDLERRLWSRLRHRQLSGYRFRRQVPIGPYIVDFACLSARLVVELDGGQHLERGMEDAARTAWLERRGFRVLRFWNSQAVEEFDAVVEAIWMSLQSEPPSGPGGPPPPQGGGALNLRSPCPSTGCG